MLIDDELQQLYEIRAYVAFRIRELKKLKRMTARENGPKKVTTQYGWMRASDLIPHLLKWDGTWEDLAKAAGSSAKTIRDIREARTQYVREDIGDAIMMALELPHITIDVLDERPINYKIPDPPPSQFFEE